MGYIVNHNTSLRIKKEHKEAALKALNECMKSKETNLLSLIENELYCVLYTEAELTLTKEGDVIIEGYYHGKCGRGEDEYILQALAPFCADTEMTYTGEDGQSWQYAFVNGKFKTRHIVWETDDEE